MFTDPIEVMKLACNLDNAVHMRIWDLSLGAGLKSCFDVEFSYTADAQWHKREDVKNALTFAEYEKAQRTSAVKVNQMCKGVEKGQNFSSDFNVESGELAPLFVPGPFAIAHHLISAWVHQSAHNNPDSSPKQLNSVSNL